MPKWIKHRTTYEEFNISEIVESHQDVILYFDFTVHYTEGDPGRMYMNNGDPGYPPEPGELEVDELEACLHPGLPQRPLEDFVGKKIAAQIESDLYEKVWENIDNYLPPEQDPDERPPLYD